MKQMIIGRLGSGHGVLRTARPGLNPRPRACEWSDAKPGFSGRLAGAQPGQGCFGRAGIALASELQSGVAGG